jgi:integrase
MPGNIAVIYTWCQVLKLSENRSRWRDRYTHVKLLPFFPKTITRNSSGKTLWEFKVNLIKELKEFTGENEFLFPSPIALGKPIGDNAIRFALASLGYDPSQITPHGFRAMASTLLNERGYSPDWIEKQLAHVSGGVRAVYNRAEYLQERQKMMQDWADFLDKLRDS